MLVENNSLQLFLNKMNALTAKGWILQLDLSQISALVFEQKRALLNDLLNDLQQNKILIPLDNPDVTQVFLYFHENKKDDIQTFIIKVRFLLGLSFTEQIGQSFYTIYHLSEDLQKLREFVALQSKDLDSLQKVTIKQKAAETAAPVLLGQLEQSLSQADVSGLIRRQSVCAIVGTGKPVELFEEIYVPQAELKKALYPQIDIPDASWVMDKLLEILDKRVLDSISHHDGGAFCKNFSVNMTTATLLSPEFEAFGFGIEDTLKNSILLEIRQNDIFNNTSAFLAAKAYLFSEGYQLCIDGVTVDSLPFLNKRKVGASFIKLNWNEGLSDAPVSFFEALKQNDPACVILNHVDDQKAIDWGHEHGINLFQGIYIQKLLYQSPRIKKG